MQAFVLWFPRLFLLLATGTVLLVLAIACRLLWDAWQGISERRAERMEATLQQASLTNILAAEVLAQIRKQRVSIDPVSGFAEVTARHPEEAANVIAQSPFFGARGTP